MADQGLAPHDRAHDAYERPPTLAGALKLLGRGGWRPLGGGTDLYPANGAGGLRGAILDLTAIPDLRGITATPEGLRIGAATTWAAIARADLPEGCAALQAAARQVGGRQVQEAGTVGGNLCNASPAADGVPPLLVLDAAVELASQRGTRRLALADFLLGPRRTARAPDELVTAILIPAAALSGRSVFLKLGARAHLVISIAMVAARVVLDGQGRIRAAALAVGSCGPVACRLPAAEAAALGRTPSDAARALGPGHLAGLAPIDDIRATADYRRRAALDLVRRALADPQGAP